MMSRKIVYSEIENSKVISWVGTLIKLVLAVNFIKIAFLLLKIILCMALRIKMQLHLDYI